MLFKLVTYEIVSMGASELVMVTATANDAKAAILDGNIHHRWMLC